MHSPDEYINRIKTKKTMKGKKVYISGKISGLSTEEVLANFSQAEKEVIAMGGIPVSPTKLPHNHERNWPSYMKEDISAMLQCDCVYVLKNWRKSDGAIVEVRTAVDLSIDLVFQK